MNRRWAARLALVAGAAALLVPLVFAGLRSFVLVGVGLAGVVVAVAGVWWVLAHKGVIRVLALLLAILAPVTVLVLYAFAGLLWVVLVSFALWALAVSVGRSALAEDTGRTPERPAAPPEHPFLIMNPRSGGGKVERFRLVERARALGAEVVVLDPGHPADVAGLARRAVDAGADLLGVAGGDGTQALVAAVAAERDVPFVVVSAGTRNHFAMDLGLDREDPSKCLEALTDGVELRVDLGYLGVAASQGVAAPQEEGAERVFVNNVSFGAYAAVVQSPAYRGDKARTTLQMLPDLLTRHSGPRLTVRAGATTIDRPQAVLVSNNAYLMGDPAGLGRREALDSGVLGVLGVTVDNAVQAALLLRGKHGPGLTSLTAREVVVDADAPGIQAGVDGEALTVPTPVRCRIEPGVLRVRLPRDRPGVPGAGPPTDWRRVRRLALTLGRTAGRREDGPRGR
ncbi:diacylglycerol/lipid kinase family protein [Streptomyces sp. NPDC057539]|uniref:diacylglycerol/lipid kinase family protein n=1 Tax=Streptomyces sp. NPDC057539 TaxID=3346159 RepID=UPI0036821443